LPAADGNLYGTTTGGGAGNAGTTFVYRLGAPVGFDMLYEFPEAAGAYPNGRYPYGGLVQAASGVLYGVTVYGGANGFGTIFSMTTAGAVSVLRSFAAYDGAVFPDGTYPYSGLAIGSDARLYGTTTQGGPTGYGTLFAIATGGAFEVLHGFSGSAAEPHATVIKASDGNLYGTTASGGAGNVGTIFRLLADGTLQILHIFTGFDGAIPLGPLVEGSDGKLYGTTSRGGANGQGTIFSITKTGQLTTLRSLALADGIYPMGALLEGADGKLYGTASEGGASNHGAVFRIAKNGAYELLHSFVTVDPVLGYAPEGKTPQAGLVLGTDGRFHGTTSFEGQHGHGAIFAVDVAGTVEVLHSFAAADGHEPIGELILRDGAFYGTASKGAGGGGSVFRFEPGAGLTVLHSFTSGEPVGSLVDAADGQLYGTTSKGGSGAGTIFRLGTGGGLVTLHTFSAASGGHTPLSGLTETSPGVFHGTASDGGAGNRGAVFMFETDGPADLIFADAFTSGTMSSWTGSSTDGGDLNVTADAGMASDGEPTNYGIQASVNDRNALYVEDETPSDETRYRVKFYVHPLTFDPGEAGGRFRVRILLGFDASPSLRRQFAVVLRRIGGQYSLMVRTTRANGTRVNTSFFPLSTAPHSIQLDWQRSSAAGVADGSLTLWIDGVQQQVVSGIDTGLFGIDLVRLGPTSIKPGANGMLYLDKFESRRSTFIP
jgi:uncharacterized repeat protein (TIGR03803 family)